MKKKCLNCGTEFTMGVNGTYYRGETPLCDTCTGVERDAEGNAWEPGETEHTYCDLLGENEHVVTREEAFRETN